MKMLAYAPFHHICRFQESASNSTQVQVKNGKFFHLLCVKEVILLYSFDSLNLFNSLDIKYWMNILQNVNFLLKQNIQDFAMLFMSTFYNSSTIIIIDIKDKGKYCWTGLKSLCILVLYTYKFFILFETII
jgi:hypothetical protein